MIRVVIAVIDDDADTIGFDDIVMPFVPSVGDMIELDSRTFHVVSITWVVNASPAYVQLAVNEVP